MRLLLAVTVLLLAGCGGEPPSPESVVRAWSESVTSGDHAAAARLFAHGARVVREGEVRTLRSFNAARGWNARLDWCARIVSVRSSGRTVRAVFVVRRQSEIGCAGPGEQTHTLFHVHDGKIVLWHQLEPGLAPDDESV